jgi:methylenetetrahydrofolate dehydrogenase (NADP+)/methenyltetrahydrofolate cyclohydrolase
MTQSTLNAVSAQKDVDGLATNTNFDPATPTAILWLLNGYNIDLLGKKIVIIGAGPLVGAPLKRILEQSQLEPLVADKQTSNLSDLAKQADILISAAGSPGLIQKEMVANNAIVIDAGTADANGKTVGDVADEVYERSDISITPKKGGVGPLTVCALFDNVLKSAHAASQSVQ